MWWYFTIPYNEYLDRNRPIWSISMVFIYINARRFPRVFYERRYLCTKPSVQITRFLEENHIALIIWRLTNWNLLNGTDWEKTSQLLKSIHTWQMRRSLQSQVKLNTQYQNFIKTTRSTVELTGRNGLTILKKLEKCTLHLLGLVAKKSHSRIQQARGWIL